MTDTEIMQRLAALMGWEIRKQGEHQGDHAWFDDPANYPHLSIDGNELALWEQPAQDGRYWRPLHDMNDAKQIIEHLKSRPEDRYWCEMRTPFMDGDQYMAGFTRWGFTGRNSDHTALADSLERAIAMAALRTAGVEVE